MQKRLLALMLCLAAMLGGCVGKDYVYIDGRDLKEGPGLFSGKDGAFTLYGGDSNATEATESPGTTGGKSQKPKKF